MCRFLTVLLCLCLTIDVALGQTAGSANTNQAGLNVKVTEARNDLPVQMATVYIVPQGDTVAVAFAFTDKKGSAQLFPVPAGRYALNVQMLGYKPNKKEVLLEARRMSSVSVCLEEDIRELEGATITAMGDLVTAKGDTLIYNATSFQTSSNANLGDLLKKMPGIEVGKGLVKVNGEPVSTITVEGKTFFSDDVSKALENLPAFIVNKIHVIDEDGRDRIGLSRKRKRMDVKLKDEFRNGWFGQASASGGASIIKKKNSDLLGDGSRALYSAKLYVSYYGDDDQATLLGGGNNINVNQLERSTPGVSNTATFGVNYNTSRIPEQETNSSASYDFKSNNERMESSRMSFLASGESLTTLRHRNNNDVNNSLAAHLSLGNPFNTLNAEGIQTTLDLNYSNRKIGREESSTMNNSTANLNSSRSLTTGSSNDFGVGIGTRGRYSLGKDGIHRISFKGNVTYDGGRGKSAESSTAWLKGVADQRALLFNDRNDAIKIDGSFSYAMQFAQHWEVRTQAGAGFNFIKETKDAQNAADRSQNEYYSKNSEDKELNLMESIVLHYGINKGGKKLVNIEFGGRVYEDKISHTAAPGVLGNSTEIWSIGAGPMASVAVNDMGKNSFTISTNGNSEVPSGTQNFNTVLDISNPVSISVGNIYLKSGYRQNLVMQARLRSEKMRNAIINIRLNGAMSFKEKTLASWYDDESVRYSIPVNAHRPHYNAGLNINYVQPLNRDKSLNLIITPRLTASSNSNYISKGPLMGLYKDSFDYSTMMSWFYGDCNGDRFYSGSSGFMESRSLRLDWLLRAELKYEILAYSIRCGGAVDNARTRYVSLHSTKVSNWRGNAFAELLWKDKSGWEVESRFDFNGYRGFEGNFNKPEFLLNFRIAKEIKSFNISLSAYDILGSNKSFIHVSSADYMEDTYYNNVGRCIILGLSYNFGKWDMRGKSRMKQLEQQKNL